MSEDREMQIAMIVICEAKSEGIKIQEGIEKEISILKGSILLEKEAAVVNASDATAKVEAALGEIHKMQSESFAISEDSAEAASHAYMKYSKELENHLEEWRNMMHLEVTRAQSLVQDIEEEKQRIEGSIGCGEKPVSQTYFEQQLKETEDVFAEVGRLVREMSTNIESQSAARLDARVKHEIENLKEKVEEAVPRLEEVYRSNERSYGCECKLTYS